MSEKSDASASSSTTGGSKDTTSVQPLDLSTLDGFARTVEQVRNSTSDPKWTSSKFVELDVKLPSDQDKNEQRVTLFMATGNQYIVGMVGGHCKPYYFQDQGK